MAGKVESICTANTSGYTCDRNQYHGALHYDSKYDTWWIFEPVNEEERLGMKPMSGYVIITDIFLKEGKL